MNARLRFSGLLTLAVFIALLSRLAYWQLVRGPELAARAKAQHFDSLEISGSRGEIKTKDGAVLAGSVSSYLLYAYKPNLNQNLEQLSEQLAEFLSQQPELVATPSVTRQLRELAIEEKKKELLLRLKRDTVWEPLGKDISPTTREEIERWDVSGLGFRSVSSRYYPEASMSAHVLGFVGSDAAGRQRGYFGLEGYYDRELRGSPGVLRQEKDALGNPILVGSFQEILSRQGRSIKLNIDRFVQVMVEQELKAGLERYGASAGEVVVIEPTTGAVIASASYPNYDPSSFGDFDPQAYRNPTISQVYEPGSTFKVLVMAAALEESVVKPDTRCDICDAPIKIGQYLIRTWDDQYHPDITMTDTIVHSDNTGMVFVGRKLGDRKLVEYLKKFGIGRPTGVDLQEETTPRLREKWGEIDVATASFGQGVALTTIQMLRAVAVIANDGVMMVPQVAAEILPFDLAQGKGEDRGIPIEPEREGRVISPQTAEEVTKMMVLAVREGEAKFAAPSDYRIAGKTGTAQIPVAGHYDQEKTIASFVGFAPADDPKFVMITKLREPTSSPWGSETAAPLWFEIAKKLLLYWGISPSGD